MVTVDMISYNIKFFREQHGWTQEQLANKMLSSRSKIAKWESNTNIPDIESLIELCDLFDVSLDHLVGRQSFQKELLTDFKRIYQLNDTNYDNDVVQLMEYILKHDSLKQSLLQLEELPIQKQKSLHHLLKAMIEEYKKI